MRFQQTALKLLIVFAATCIACGQRPQATGNIQTGTTAGGDVKFRVETVASGLEVPWAFVWLPNKDLLFTERLGRVRIIESGTLRVEPVFTVPDVEPSSESGLMDITLHPNFAKNNFIYLSYAYNKE